MSIYEKLNKIQVELKAPKGQFNSFGKYKYRSCEDILEAVKPLLAEYKCALTVYDSLQHIGERYYIEATAVLMDCESNGDTVHSTGYAREEAEKKGMDGSQVTGAASSYARKYALNGLFAIDDNKDSDATNKHGIEDGEEKQKVEIKKPEEKKVQVDSKLITEAQRKRLYAISKGDTELIKSVVSSYGYESSKDIDASHYDKVCKAIEDLVATKEGN